MQIQFQIGGAQNQQIIRQTIEDSLGRLLNEAEQRLRDRTFLSPEVKRRYEELLIELSLWIFENRQHTFDASKFVKFPFKTLPEDETFQDSYFLESLLDTLSIIAFSNFECVIEHNYLNIKIKCHQKFGIYYQKGLYTLVDSFQRLIKDLKRRGVILPPGFIFIILNCIGAQLEADKIRNIVTDILGDDPYIKPLQMGTPKCVSVTSYIIQECQSVDEACAHILEVLSVA